MHRLRQSLNSRNLFSSWLHLSVWFRRSQCVPNEHDRFPIDSLAAKSPLVILIICRIISAFLFFRNKKVKDRVHEGRVNLGWTLGEEESSSLQRTLQHSTHSGIEVNVFIHTFADEHCVFKWEKRHSRMCSECCAKRRGFEVRKRAPHVGMPIYQNCRSAGQSSQAVLPDRINGTVHTPKSSAELYSLL